MNVLCLNMDWKQRQRKRVLFVFGKCGLIKGREREAAASYWFLPNYENGCLHKNLEGGNSSLGFNLSCGFTFNSCAVQHMLLKFNSSVQRLYFVLGPSVLLQQLNTSAKHPEGKPLCSVILEVYHVRLLS